MNIYQLKLTTSEEKMVLWQLLADGSILILRGDYPPGTTLKTDSHLAIILALFMIYAAEVFIIKILTFDMQHQSQDSRNLTNSLLFNIDM